MQPVPKVPDHVTSERVINFDFMRPNPDGSDLYLVLKKLHNGPDIFWTPCNGGHWVATRGEDIKELLTDYQTFSSRAVFIPPFDRPPVIPLEMDPPNHSAYRRLLNPVLD